VIELPQVGGLGGLARDLIGKCKRESIFRPRRDGGLSESIRELGVARHAWFQALGSSAGPNWGAAQTLIITSIIAIRRPS